MSTPTEEESAEFAEEEGATPEDFVPLLECLLPARADFYVSLLEGHGIPVFVDNEHASAALPFLSTVSRGIKIQVLEEDVEKAFGVLSGHPELGAAVLEEDLVADFEEMEEDEGYEDDEDYEPDTDPEIEAEEEGPALCPNCGSENVGVAQLPTWFRVLVTILLLGLPLLTSDNRARWSCLDCDWEWRE